jgi:hypothetical protein
MDTNNIGVLSNRGKIFNNASTWRKKAIKINSTIIMKGNFLIEHGHPFKK